MGSEFGITKDTKPELRLGALGIFYVVFASLWTVILLGGMTFLWVRRDMPILRIRGLPMSFAAIGSMHLYWIAVELAYWYGPLMPELAEFWVMSIWFPFGIALFHASNSRFLYVADAQRKFIKSEAPVLPVDQRSLLARWRRIDYGRRTLILLFTGMGLHLILTLFAFLISRKFHESFGISGTEVHGNFMERKVAQGRGWEWFPSIFWQIFWAWIFAPYILFRARKLRDTQGWRFQTIACCISNLHSAPMWLVALYVPAMESINNYFIPPQWIALSILLLEIFTVFVPVIEVWKHKALTQETLNSIERWESRKKGLTGGDKSFNSDFTRSSWGGRTGRASSVFTNSSGGSILTMEALEHTLSKNPQPLQQFSALRDFSGENIAFLTRVKEWKTIFLSTAKQSEKDDGAVNGLSRECFESALKIYVEFISATHAEFQINLSSTDFKGLQTVFEDAANAICGSESSNLDPCTPFDDISHRTDSDSTLNMVRYWGEVPSEFNRRVFDDAEVSIKYLVLTNTWPKFIKERRSFDIASVVETGSN